MKQVINVLCVIIIFILAGTFVNAQIDIKGKIKNKAIDRANQHVDEGIDKTFDAVENGAKDAVTGDDKEQSDKKEESESNDQQQDNNSNQNANQNSQGNNQTQPSLSTYSKFDFIPGDKVIFYDDFAQDALADFPALWNTNGSGEIITTNLYPGNWFKMVSGAFMPDLTIPFNENFTFECDLIFKDIPESSSSENFNIYMVAAPPDWQIGDPIQNGCAVYLGKASAWAESWKDNDQFFQSIGMGFNMDDMTNKIRVSVWIQKQRLRLYINEKKVLDLPKLISPGLICNLLEFESSSYEGNNSLMTNVRVAYGAPDTRNKLLTIGKLVTYGITFDVNSDKIKPESYGTLKDIAAVLTENPTVRIMIVGHTDSDGNDASNFDLSKQRAASVKNALSTSFSVDASRIETDGKGETQPVAPNDTPSNKAQNRRVEIIKL